MPSRWSCTASGSEDEPESNFNIPVDNLLWHEGKVRAVGDGSFELADMLYSVNIIPLGGFVRLAGESNPTVPLSLASRPPWQRVVVLSAGAAMNALLPLAIFTIMFMLPQEVEVRRTDGHRRQRRTVPLPGRDCSPATYCWPPTEGPLRTGWISPERST